MSARLFGPRPLAWLIGMCVVSLIVGILAGVFGGDIASYRSSGPDAFSRSALGHKAFVELLRELGVPVSLQLAPPATATGRGGVLVIAEPRLYGPDDPGISGWEDYYAYFYSILIVLPKREGRPDPGRPSWVQSTWMVPEHKVKGVFEALGIDAEITRPGDGPLHWLKTLEGLPAPDLPQPQLLRSDDLTPVWTAREGVLAATWQPDPDIDETIIVLSDPDLLSNHGIGRGGNAAHALDLIRRLGGLEDRVLIDETFHGYEAPRSIWRGFFRFPLSLVLIQVLLAGTALLWLAMGRFGNPTPPPPAHEPGHSFLMNNTAELLVLGGHDRSILGRYYETTVSGVARALHLDVRLDAAEVRDRLTRIGQNRGVSVDLDSLQDRMEKLGQEQARTFSMLETAGDIHRWKREMTHGL